MAAVRQKNRCNMGFQISLKETDDLLLRKLLSDPKEIFSKPYIGYLIFAVGKSDTDQMDWLKANLIELDALTRDIIAFSIIAEEVRVELKIGDCYSEKRSPRYLGEFEISEVYRIDSLARNGKLEKLTDGDFLSALTYGAGRVSRFFNVIDKMPCIIAIDGNNPGSYSVIEFDSELVSDLIKIMRKVVSALISNVNCKLYLDLVKKIGEIDDELNRERFRQNPNLYADQSSFESALFTCLEDINSALERGTHRGFRSALGRVEKKLDIELSYDLSEHFGSIISGTTKTIEHLNKFENENWPLNPESFSNFEALINKHAARLHPDVKNIKILNNPDFCNLLISMLKELKRKYVEEIVAGLNVSSAARKVYFSKVKMENDWKDKISALESRRSYYLNTIAENKFPSVHEELQKELKLRSKNIFKRKLIIESKEYASKVLDPKNILKIFGI